jgi:predicted nucleic acid-binding protein
VALALVDGSAIVAYLLEDDALHPSAVEAIERAMRAGDSLAMSVVTWSETLHGALLGYVDEHALRELAADFGIEVLPADAEVAEHAATLQKSYRATKAGKDARLRTPDALILATSVAYAGIDTVICGDEQWTNVPGVSARIVLLRAR